MAGSDRWTKPTLKPDTVANNGENNSNLHYFCCLLNFHLFLPCRSIISRFLYNIMMGSAIGLSLPWGEKKGFQLLYCPTPPFVRHRPRPLSSTPYLWSVQFCLLYYHSRERMLGSFPSGSFLNFSSGKIESC